MPSLIDRVAQLAKQARVTKGHKLRLDAACVQTNIHHPSEEKVLSLFEPHTRVIPRHKGGTEVELGRLVTLDEVEGGIVTRFEILEQPSGHGRGEAALMVHQRRFGHPPRLLAGDRGVHSPSTRRTLEQAGVQVVAIPAV